MEEQEANETLFTKEQLLKSQKYSQQRDIISAMFDDGQKYTHEDAENIIEEFLRGEVE